MADLEASKTRYINQWSHCGKQLTATSPLIHCECGQSWPWVNTLGETMEMLEWSEDVKLRVAEVPSSGDAEQPGLF